LPLHVERAGAGPPYLLLHGLGGEACVWEPIMERLADRHDVLAMDLPGFGRSPALADGQRPTAAALARAIAAELDDLGLTEPVRIAGNSLGGWVALELALLGRARSVAGVCPAGLWGAPLVRDGDSEAVVRGRAHRAARRVRWLIPVAMRSRRVREVILAPFVAHPERVPYHAAWRMVSSYARATAYEATSAAMRSGAFTGARALSVPVVLAFGERDRLIRPTRLDGARSLLLPGCGHIPMWDDPDRVTQVLTGVA
jgi:pimeloyl-ACP methyl ester carboxylesterase